MSTFINFYNCPCGEAWADIWDCMCNDKCPVCCKEIEPYYSEDIESEESMEPDDNGPNLGVRWILDGKSLRAVIYSQVSWLTCEPTGRPRVLAIGGKYTVEMHPARGPEIDTRRKTFYLRPESNTDGEGTWASFASEQEALDVMQELQDMIIRINDPSYKLGEDDGWVYLPVVVHQGFYHAAMPDGTHIPLERIKCAPGFHETANDRKEIGSQTIYPPTRVHIHWPTYEEAQKAAQKEKTA